jgi:hypothetical protein
MLKQDMVWYGMTWCGIALHRIWQLLDGVRHLTRQDRQRPDIKGQRLGRKRSRKEDIKPFLYSHLAASTLQLAWWALPANASEKPQPQEARTSMEQNHHKDRTPEVPHSFWAAQHVCRIEPGASCLGSGG